MTDERTGPTRHPEPSLKQRAIRFVEEFHWLHTTLGLIGNVSFLVGSVFFLWEATKLAGIWLFIVGALGMMLGSIGDAVAKMEGDA